MSDAGTIRFFVQKEVLDAGVRIVFPVIEGIDNTKVSGEWKEKRAGMLSQLSQRYMDLDYREDPILEGFNVLHDRTGVKRRKNVPASENLIRLLRKHGGMPLISQAVDIYNLISMDSKLALGAHDIDRIDGNVTLRFTDGSERFVPIGQSEPASVSPHEYSYCDDNNEILCRLEIRQVEKTKVTEETENVFYIVQGNDAAGLEYVTVTAQRIIDETVKYCGGKGRIIIPEVI